MVTFLRAYGCQPVAVYLRALIDSIAWEYKLLGTQRSARVKSFFSIRPIHIAERFDALLFRSFRVKAIIKAINRRGKTRKKVPTDADLLRWIRQELVRKGSVQNGNTLQ